MNGLLVALAATALFQAPELPSWVPDFLRNGDDYEWVRGNGPTPTEFPRRLLFNRRPDGMRVILKGDVSTPRRATSPYSIDIASGKPLESDALPASGIPIGRQALFTRFDAGLDAQIVGDWEFLTITIHGPVVREGRSRYIKEVDLVAEKPFIEALARKTLGRLAARRMGPIRSVGLAGRTVRAVTAEGSDVVLYALDDWALARSVSLNRNTTHARVSFNRGTTSHLATLGSHHLKRGGTWLVMPDVVVEHQGVWWVPRAALEPSS